MTVTLKNDLLTVEINSHGAELKSIRNNRNGYEYLWQGDPAYWGRRSPVLFPIVGAVWNGELRIDGLIYPMSQHGFARDCEFELIDGDDDCDSEAWFRLTSDADSLKVFPYGFRLEIGYSLMGERISVMWRVINTDTRDIAFQIGAHPAFNLPEFSPSDSVHGYFNFDGRDFVSQTIEKGGCIGKSDRIVTTDEDGMYPIGSSTFDSDALIFACHQVSRVSLLDKQCRPYLTLLFSAPVVGLWSPPQKNAPFVCIEPWWGRADRVEYTGEFVNREYVNRLSVGDIFSVGYMIIVDNL